MKNVKKAWDSLRTGFITGSADNDPSGIATYAQIGAKLGFLQLWATLYMVPMMISVQESCARIGAVTGKGLAATIKIHYNKIVLYILVSLLVIANVINIGADIGAMAAATQLLFPINFGLATLLFSIVMVLVEIYIPYKDYANILKYLCLTLLVYPLTLLFVNVPWVSVIKATLVPHIELNKNFLFFLIAILGTTISPYLFFWQSSQEVEEGHLKRLRRAGQKPKMNHKIIKRIQVDNFIGMVFSEFIAWAVIVLMAVTLHREGVTHIQSAADAAKSLEPFVNAFPNSGYIAKCLFAAGIIGGGLMAIPILAASAGYAVGEALGYKVGLRLKLMNAKLFYGIIAVATALGLLINFVNINPFDALVYSAVINGIIAIPLIFIIMLIGNNETVMGRFKNGILSNVFLLITLFCMFFAILGMFLL